MTDDDRTFMEETVMLARAAAGTPGPNGIAALVVRDGVVLARGVNEVHLKHDPTRHAEIVAIAAAAEAIGGSSLAGATLYSSLQPCEMCLAAMRFADIERLVFAARQEHVAPKYFQFPGLTLDAFRSASKVSFEAVGGVLEERCLDLYATGSE